MTSPGNVVARYVIAALKCGRIAAQPASRHDDEGNSQSGRICKKAVTSPYRFARYGIDSFSPSGGAFSNASTCASALSWKVASAFAIFASATVSRTAWLSSSNTSACLRIVIPKRSESAARSLRRTRRSTYPSIAWIERCALAVMSGFAAPCVTMKSACGARASPAM
ncbi:hypothetical protein [Polyangium fumosum]|uniref:Uncharacterized protein n=1 Tax=Polyangium fumosum TaxID=889272 RepID=A0A4U1J9Z4_9BACT|nr:hypothetical protein [Polyangium fumosum]TKD05056.1 hypothetical protein E8A74_22590 [Polyangium fumosum]